MRIHVLRSPAGGGRRSRAAAELLQHELRHLGHELVDLTGDSTTESVRRLRLAIDSDQVERVLVAGGDGLVHLAIQELAETSIPVALAPVGTGNDFASSLGIFRPSTETTLASPIAIALIRVNSPSAADCWVASIAIAGFPAAINARANAMSLPLGAHVYTVAAAVELPRFSRISASIRLDGYPIELDSAMLAIGNTKLFGGGMVACPDAQPTDGLLHLTSIEGVGRLGILRHLISRGGGTADRPEVLRRTAIHIDLDTHDIAVWGDGESIGSSPLSFTIAPGALLIAGANLT